MSFWIRPVAKSVEVVFIRWLVRGFFLHGVHLPGYGEYVLHIAFDSGPAVIQVE
jgi:hypothetical protein